MLSARSTTVTNELNVWILNETVCTKLNETWRYLTFQRKRIIKAAYQFEKQWIWARKIYLLRGKLKS